MAMFQKHLIACINWTGKNYAEIEATGQVTEVPVGKLNK